jgi:hypothetical protein
MTTDYGYHRGFRLQKAGPALLIVLSLTGLAFIAEQPFGTYRKVDALGGLSLAIG